MTTTQENGSVEAEGFVQLKPSKFTRAVAVDLQQLQAEEQEQARQAYAAKSHDELVALALEQQKQVADLREQLEIKIPDIAREWKFSTGCDCGCNTPCFTEPLEALRFLMHRMNGAGVSHAVSQSYAHDIHRMLSSMGELEQPEAEVSDSPYAPVLAKYAELQAQATAQVQSQLARFADNTAESNGILITFPEYSNLVKSTKPSVAEQQDLLELAAKAVGKSQMRYCEPWKCMAAYSPQDGFYGQGWNPLKNRKDALEVLVALQMSSIYEPSQGGWLVGKIVENTFNTLAHDEQDYLLAIVRAASIVRN